MSKNYLKWKRYYRQGSITREQLAELVGKEEGITAEEYTKITGEAFGA